MRETTKNKFDEIVRYPWFKSCGADFPGPVPLKSWGAAVKQSKSRTWQNCRLMARNALQTHLEKKSWERVEEWNPITDELRSIITQFVSDLATKTEAPIAQIKGAVSWDIMFICMECEYADLVKPIFFLPLIDPLYAAGHFPCGWTGEEFPEGWEGVIRQGEVIVF